MINPIIGLDYPDPDIIRVDDTYYMGSTTMYFMPGCEILRSYDLINWEHATFVYDVLDSTKASRLETDENIYGKGMWAATLRYHRGIFYIVFVCNDTHKTYLYTTNDIYGKWDKKYIDGFYHDPSLLFDDDGKIYIAYGNRNIYITELKEDLSGPKEDGLNILAIKDSDKTPLGYEGTHFYKINGVYYLFFIHSLEDRWMRTQAVFTSKNIEGKYEGMDVLCDDINYLGSGCAQGGIVDTPLGDYYSIVFQDRGAVGRIPVLTPVAINDTTVIYGHDGKIPNEFKTPDITDYKYAVLAGSDDFKTKGPSFGLKSFWQFNHEPKEGFYHIDYEKGLYSITTNKLCNKLPSAQNTITQRLYYPADSVSVYLDASKLNNGDFAGLCVLQLVYSFEAVTKENDKLYKVIYHNGKEISKVLLSDETDDTNIKLSFKVDFTNGLDEVRFNSLPNQAFKMYFKIEHFTGNRAGLFMYSTIKEGGCASFKNFTLTQDLDI